MDAFDDKYEMSSMVQTVSSINLIETQKTNASTVHYVTALDCTHVGAGTRCVLTSPVDVSTDLRNVKVALALKCCHNLPPFSKNVWSPQSAGAPKNPNPKDATHLVAKTCALPRRLFSVRKPH